MSPPSLTSTDTDSDQRPSISKSYVIKIFKIIFQVGKDYENEMKAFSEKIRSSLNEYYNEWTCKYDDDEEYRERLEINNEWKKWPFYFNISIFKFFRN